MPAAPAAEDAFQVRSEFTWTKLEFAPLVWQYDREPQTVDIRDGADGSDARETGRPADGRRPRRGGPQEPAPQGPSLSWLG